MKILSDENIHLRALEPEDLNFLFTIENDESFWEVVALRLLFQDLF